MSHLVAREGPVARRPVPTPPMVTTRAVALVRSRTRATSLDVPTERASGARRAAQTNARRARLILAELAALTHAAREIHDPLALIHAPRARVATLVPKRAAMLVRHDRTVEVLVPMHGGHVPMLAAPAPMLAVPVPTSGGRERTIAGHDPTRAGHVPTNAGRVPTHGLDVPTHEARGQRHAGPDPMGALPVRTLAELAAILAEPERRDHTPRAKCHQKRWSVAARPSTVVARGGEVSRERARCT